MAIFLFLLIWVPVSDSDRNLCPETRMNFLVVLKRDFFGQLSYHFFKDNSVPYSYLELKTKQKYVLARMFGNYFRFYKSGHRNAKLFVDSFFSDFLLPENFPIVFLYTIKRHIPDWIGWSPVLTKRENKHRFLYIISHWTQTKRIFEELSA
jgi:hypothetical protein